MAISDAGEIKVTVPDCSAPKKPPLWLLERRTKGQHSQRRNDGQELSTIPANAVPLEASTDIAGQERAGYCDAKLLHSELASRTEPALSMITPKPPGPSGPKSRREPAWLAKKRHKATLAEPSAQADQTRNVSSAASTEASLAMCNSASSSAASMAPFEEYGKEGVQIGSHPVAALGRKVKASSRLRAFVLKGRVDEHKAVTLQDFPVLDEGESDDEDDDESPVLSDSEGELDDLGDEEDV
eukprot:TRINITY_DN20613_c0_g1_i1.p1 TRINITY_DN20613_c0_g1~~TRINITY_DN20613_c0_g1_i1.p1  ORF type:complete len:253 (+),score=46.66 TRINITY_DN20613_c0_g1_i1:39-761(+)